MPLDTGGITDLHLDADHGRAPGPAPSYAPTIHSGSDIGEALRTIREFKGLTLEAVAEITRVRRAYLQAIEELKLDVLPSRPFTIGYIRAYADALGVDTEAAVTRFKAEEPVLDEPLREPVGVNNDRDPRLTAVIAGGCVIVAAIVLWNIAQRAMSEAAPPPPTATEAATVQALTAKKAGPVELGAPLPPPVESTTPAPYETPGMAAAGEDGMGNHAPPATLGAVAADAVPADTSQLAATFTPEGRIYGAVPGQPSTITLKALKSASLIVRGADGSVYFARQLDKGEAYRVPQNAGLVVDVSDPQAFQVFAAGQSKGFLPSPQAAVSKLQG